MGISVGRFRRHVMDTGQISTIGPATLYSLHSGLNGILEDEIYMKCCIRGRIVV